MHYECIFSGQPLGQACTHYRIGLFVHKNCSKIYNTGGLRSIIETSITVILAIPEILKYSIYRIKYFDLYRYLDYWIMGELFFGPIQCISKKVIFYTIGNIVLYVFTLILYGILHKLKNILILSLSAY